MTENKNELAKPDETPEKRLQRLAREKKAADLRYQLARLEAGEDVELGEHEGGRQGSELAPLDAQAILGGMGQIVKYMNNQGVEDETAGDAEGGPGIKFKRHAGQVKNVKLNRRGQIEEVEFAPEEWPPRHEKFGG